MLTYVKHSVDVVDVTMFPTAVMDVILGHSNLGSVEHGGLVSGHLSSGRAKQNHTSFISFQMNTFSVLSTQDQLSPC